LRAITSEVIAAARGVDNAAAPLASGVNAMPLFQRHRWIPLLLLIGLSVLTVLGIVEVGITGLFVDNLNHAAGRQIFFDLGVALTLVLTGLWRDARARGRSPWPWFGLTIAAGSFGPLIYILTTPRTAPSEVSR
jgi:hypothetical protein